MAPRKKIAAKTRTRRKTAAPPDWRKTLEHGDYVTVVARVNTTYGNNVEVEIYDPGDADNYTFTFPRNEIHSKLENTAPKVGDTVRCTNCNGVGVVKHILDDKAWVRSTDDDGDEYDHIEPLSDLRTLSPGS